MRVAQNSALEPIFDTPLKEEAMKSTSKDITKSFISEVASVVSTGSLNKIPLRCHSNPKYYKTRLEMIVKYGRKEIQKYDEFSEKVRK